MNNEIKVPIIIGYISGIIFLFNIILWKLLWQFIILPANDLPPAEPLCWLCAVLLSSLPTLITAFMLFEKTEYSSSFLINWTTKKVINILLTVLLILLSLLIIVIVLALM